MKMKNNRESFWSIPIMLLFMLVGSFFIFGGIQSEILIFLIIMGMFFLMIYFWDVHYFSSLENTLDTFSNRYDGSVELVNVTEGGEIVNYDAKGTYFNRTFHIDTEFAIKSMGLKGNIQMMNVRLQIDSPVIVSLKLKRRPFGRVNLAPSTIVDVYDIRFPIQNRRPSVGGLTNVHSERFKNEFVNQVDQQKLGVKLSALGKKYRDYLSRFYIYTDGQNIGVHKCQMIRSVDDMENLMNSLKEIAEIIEDLSHQKGSL